MMRMVTATLIMYYRDRETDGEMRAVAEAMRNAFRVCALDGDNPGVMLAEWGAAIRLQWDSDNLHLTAQLGDNGSAQIIHHLKGLGKSVSRVSSGVAQL